MLSRPLVLVSLLLLPSLYATEQTPAYHKDAIGLRRLPPKVRLGEARKIAPSSLLPSAERGALDQLRAMAEWNAAHRAPLQSGFVRQLPSPLVVSVADGSAKSRGIGVTRVVAGRTIWEAAVRVENAKRVRLHLEQLTLPEDALLAVYAPGDPGLTFGRELLGPSGDLWTPSVEGALIYLQVETSSPVSFRIGEVADIHLGEARSIEPDANTSCIEDCMCVTPQTTFEALDALKAATAHLHFIKNSIAYVCSGGLIEDKDSKTSIPYFLTANSCMSDQATVSTLESYWDYRRLSCGGFLPSLSNVPRSNGGTLLATSASAGEFALLRLNSVPDGRWFMGWTKEFQNNGTPLYRISHPSATDLAVEAQGYSSQTLNNTTPACSNRPRPAFLYSNIETGGVFTGSVGSLVTDYNGLIIGQLSGQCGQTPSEGCDTANHVVDGAFQTTYDLVKGYVDIAAPATTCTANATTLCLNNNRFKVEVDWTNFEGGTGKGQGVSYTTDSGLFWFFDSKNIEMLVKVLNGCGVNSRLWFFAAATTNVRYTLKVTDTRTGTVKTYNNPLGTSAAAITDTGAFTDCSN